ncbi:MAG: succinate dehydrogenase, cytochrome b556 subunit [bacterium]
MNKQRPVNLDIGTIKLPITSYASILHRVSGVILFFATAFFIWLLDVSLASEEGFNSIKDGMDSFLCKLILWVALSGLLYHLVAGIRHIIMDCGIGESLEGGRLGARLVLIISAVLIAIAGVWIWA